MLLLIKIDTTRPVDVSIRAWRDFSRAGMQAVAAYWDQHLKMKHFEAGAESEYGYKPRSAKYLKRKRAGWVRKGAQRYQIPDGGTSPIVFRGDTRADMRATHYPEAFPSRVLMRMPVRGDYIRMKPDPRTRDAPNLGEELTRVTPEENAVLAKVYQDAVTPLLVQYREPSSRQI